MLKGKTRWWVIAIVLILAGLWYYQINRQLCMYNASSSDYKIEDC
jgi:hypothetical protein